MAAGELLEPNQIMFSNWEPKLKNRFIMSIISYLSRLIGPPLGLVIQKRLPYQQFLGR